MSLKGTCSVSISYDVERRNAVLFLLIELHKRQEYRVSIGSGLNYRE